MTSPKTTLSALLSALFFTGIAAAEPAKKEVRPTGLRRVSAAIPGEASDKL